MIWTMTVRHYGLAEHLTSRSAISDFSAHPPKLRKTLPTVPVLPGIFFALRLVLLRSPA